MRILWLTPIFPYPPFSGGQTRSYNLIKNLAKKNQITLFSFIRPARIQGPISELEKFCDKIRTFKGRRIWTLRNIFLAGASHLPFTITHFYGDRQLEKALREELKSQKYDLVHFESFYTSCYLNFASSLPKVLGNENIEYLIYQRFVEQKSPFLKLPLLYDIWKMKRYEQGAWEKADLNLAVSGVDADKIRKVTGRQCVVIPNGVDVEYFGEIGKAFSIKAKRPTVLFVGDFKYFPNKDAIRFLIKEIWPLIKRRLPQAKLLLVGKNPNQFVSSLAGGGVIVDDQVEDIRQAYSQADIFVAPMRLASGTNIKVLEAMAAGLPVVTSSIGIEGVKAEKEKEVIVADKPDDFADQVAELLSDKKKRQRIGLAGRKLVRRLYDWSEITKKLEEAYQKLSYGKKS